MPSEPATAADIPYEGTDCTPEEAVAAVNAARATATRLRLDVEDLIERYTLLIELYAKPMPTDVNGASYESGFHAGVRKAYLDAVVQLQAVLS